MSDNHIWFCRPLTMCAYPNPIPATVSDLWQGPNEPAWIVTENGDQASTAAARASTQIEPPRLALVLQPKSSEAGRWQQNWLLRARAFDQLIFPALLRRAEHLVLGRIRLRLPSTFCAHANVPPETTFHGTRLRRQRPDRARGTGARERPWHPTCFRSRQSAAVVKCSRRQTRNVGQA